LEYQNDNQISYELFQSEPKGQARVKEKSRHEKKERTGKRKGKGQARKSKGKGQARVNEKDRQE
jgi:ribosomal protein L19E